MKNGVLTSGIGFVSRDLREAVRVVKPDMGDVAADLWE
jgi:hypothetical protein